MPNVRSGHHADVGFVFEDAGYDASPNDTTIKTFGGNATMDTFDASHEAVREYNASRTAANIIEQAFDGGWGVTFDLGAEPPWWLAGIFGQPTSTNVSGSLYDYTYDLDNGNDPVSLRLYAPTEGFSNYEMLPGCYIVSASIDQSQGSSPEVNLTGGYAREPVNQSTPSVSIPDFGETTFSNRDGEVTVDGSSVARLQNTTLNLETNTDGIGEIGSEALVDFSPKAFTPNMTYDHIVWVGQNVDVLQRFRDGNQVAVDLTYDNGLTGEDAYTVDFQSSGALPNQFSESGRNDPDADLMEESTEMIEDTDVVVSTDAGDSGNPPGITL
jgi:hypothetical protein